MKRLGRIGICCLLAVALVGCASSVQTGALIGAGAGAAAGAGVGVLITSDELAGSSATGPGGDTSLPSGESILASTAVGFMVGGIIGAMVGHQREQTFVRRKAVPPPPPDAQASTGSRHIF
jgi:hypothetical protein